MVAGVLSALVFERRRARRALGHGPERRAPAGPPDGHAGGDRLGEKRRADLLGERWAQLARHADEVRALEEVHLVPRTRPPEPGLAGAVAAWARGAPFGTVLEVAAGRRGRGGPGGLRAHRASQVADLAGQVALVAPDPATGGGRPTPPPAGCCATWWPPAAPRGIRHRRGAQT